MELTRSMTDSWTARELRRQLAEYERVLLQAGLSSLAVRTYFDRARWFVDWLEHAAPTPAMTADPQNLADGLLAYRRHLSGSGRRPRTLAAYLDGASRYLRWLLGDYQPSQRGGRPVEATGTEVGGQAPVTWSWPWGGRRPGRDRASGSEMMLGP